MWRESNEMIAASNNNSRISFLLLLLLLLYCVLACNHASWERSTKVTIAEDNYPPTFSLSGNGTLINFIVVGPFLSLADVQSYKPDVAVAWQLSPGDHAKTTVEDLAPITYGTIPSGFEQIIPKAGFPPPLEEGKFYRIGTPTFGADFRVLCFNIENARARTVPCRE